QVVRDAAVTAFIADQPGVYVANLVVSNGTLTSARDTVVVTTEAENATPIADAGTDQDVRIGTTVLLDGRASTDAEHAQLIYGWSLIFRPFSSRAVLRESTTATPSFIADQPGPYLAQLVVFDGVTYSPPSIVLVVSA